MNPHQAIRDLLSEHSIHFREYEHEPVHTSDEAALVRGKPPEHGAKSLLLKGSDGEYVLAILPGSERLDTKKLRRHLGVKSMRFATPTEVIEKMHCEIGSCYPLGCVVGLRTVVEQKLLTFAEIDFNPGSHSHSIAMSPQDYVAIQKPEIADIREDR